VSEDRDAAAPQYTGPAASPVGAVVEQFGQTWTASLDLWSAWANAWGKIVQTRGVPAAEAVTGKLLNPAAWPGGLQPLAEEFEDLFALPRFADLPGLDGAKLPSLAPVLELMAVAQQYMLAAAPVWLEASRSFQAEVAERRQAGERMDSAGAALDLWNGVLDRTLMQFNRSSEFAAVQQRFLHAAMRQRQEIRKLFGGAAKAVDLPTGAEMKEVYRRLHDLQREVHALKRELREVRQAKDGGGRERRGTASAATGGQGDG
jgi:Poly(R)-hydroxyalkanoic acid synthase subunit (PHA_synth_III_E)